VFATACVGFCQSGQVLTAGVDLAAQPAKTGLVVVDWSTERPSVLRADVHVIDEQILALCTEVTASGGQVGIDCPFGRPRPFVAFVNAHAKHEPLPKTELDTGCLRLRTTDIALHERLKLTPLFLATLLCGALPTGAVTDEEVIDVG
jgi:hypothetical protein